MIKKLLLVPVMLLLMIGITLAYPNLMYNRNRVSEGDLNRFRAIMRTIPEEYFNIISKKSIS